MHRRQFLQQTLKLALSGVAGIELLGVAAARASMRSHTAKSARVAVIIDDIGYSRARALSFLELKLPLTFAILPRLQLTRELAHRLHARGHEILLHQPMEPLSREFDPGPGTLYAGAAPVAIERIVAANLGQVPHTVGVNNHMGSRFTALEREMTCALKQLRDRGLFFIDSLTTHRSVGYQTARSLGITALRRSVFLDNRRDFGHITSQLRQLCSRARRHGRAVGIGHPFAETAAAVGAFFGGALPPAAQMVPVSKIL